MQTSAAIGVGAVALAVVLLPQGTTVSSSYLKPYSISVAAVFVAFEFFDRWLWRWGPIPLLVGRPVVRGTWRGTLRSTWMDPESGAQAKPIPLFLVLRQSYSKLDARLITEDSSSISLVSSMDSADEIPTI